MQPPTAPKLSGTSQPADAYKQRLTLALSQEESLGRRTSLIGTLRFFAFALTLLAVGAAYDGRGPRGPLWALGLASLVAFIALVVHHGSLHERVERLRLLAATNRAGLRRLDGTWAEEPCPPSPLPAQLPPYAVDLDLDGPSSLAALIDTTQTRYGQAALWRSLSHAAEPGDAQAARARQEAVRELGPLLDLRQSVEVAGRAMHRNLGPALGSLGGKKQEGRRGGEPDPEPLLRWAEEPPVLSQTPILRLLALLPLVTIPVLVARTLLAEIPPVLGGLTLVLLGLQGVALLFSATHITRLLNRVSSSEGALSAYGELLTLMCEAPLQATANRALQARLRGDGGKGLATPEQALTRLRSIYGMLELRHNPLVWFPINILLMWDLQFALRLERWQVQHGPRLRGWMESLGEFEASASLAHLAHDNPDWAWPEFIDAARTDMPDAKPEGGLLVAEGLAHPLLPAGRRRGNDVTISGLGQALLVTGSNMSGKSTLLRSVGLLQVLAQAGAPVCATRARLPMLMLRTVVRVDDSLARGLSHFYAELRRLKEVVDAAGRRADAPLLFLLDEILHGTNTRERELGARLTIRTLCQRGAIGVVTTHDLSLATLEAETGGAVRNFHFTEVVQGGTLHFDYQLRSGPVQTTNALRLMRECGIAIDWSLAPAESAPPSQ